MPILAILCDGNNNKLGVNVEFISHTLPDNYPR
jgi:hypothetical protein